MLKKLLTGSALAAGLVFATASFAAEGWGIKHEKITRAEVKVVDLLCEITGNCVPQCGAGKRQLGLLFDDGRLVPVVKGQDLFANAVPDLVQYCNKRIVADGLLIDNPKMRMFMLQFKRSAPPGKPKGKWSRASQFSKDWGKANPGKPADEWYNHDAQVKEALAKDGVLGIKGLKPPKN